MSDDAVSGTRERSVAEIIGWDKLPDIDGPLGGMEGGWSRPGVGAPSEPTPDDMLAWLRADGSYLLYVSVGVDEVSVEVATSIHSRLAFTRGFTAPTLHAALEAACRAVAEAEGGAG